MLGNQKWRESPVSRRVIIFGFLSLPLQLRSQPANAKRDLPPRCWGMKSAACAGTRPQVFTIMSWVVRAVRASSGAASSKELSTPAKAAGSVTWTCTCAGSARNAGWKNADKQACGKNVSRGILASTTCWDAEQSHCLHHHDFQEWHWAPVVLVAILKKNKWWVASA